MAANRFERRPRRTIVALWLLSLVTLALSVEVSYRYQVIDFYRPELRLANEPGALDPSRKPARTILVMGDSFTAWPSSYPSLLATRVDPGVRVVNSGVSGFTIRQIVRLLPRRLAEFDPDTVVLQLFSGNDLIEMCHPVAWTRMSPLRNLFWLASDSSVESVGFLNYRAGSILGAFLRGLRPSPSATSDPVNGPGFSIERYSAHERTLIAAQPDYVEQQLQVMPAYRSAYSEYLKALQGLLDAAQMRSRRVIVLVVPHPVQVHNRYLKRYRALGGRIGDAAWTTQTSSPFLDGVSGVVLRGTGMRPIDPVGALREKERDGIRTFRDTDLHLNAIGQEVLARLLLDELHRIQEVTGPRQ